MFGLPGGSEWVLILLIVIILFGAKKIPDLMKGIGSGIREFKKAASGDDSDSKSDKS
ncbi:MAG: twin-arginine translocase TatA/TatE family subunit [Candidatus Kapabacteria bacterium]|nr:twin-arginine translocase TatA/TatE family subunit [Candidatus Kapabacteria bacterium]